MTLSELLAVAVEAHGSDVHLTAGQPPLVRVHGDLLRVEDQPVLTSADIEQMVRHHLSDRQQAQFKQTCELDFSTNIDDIVRIRGNLFRQRGGAAAVFRLIPKHVPASTTSGCRLRWWSSPAFPAVSCW